MEQRLADAIHLQAGATALAYKQAGREGGRVQEA
jgi:hypothetical protein